MSGMKRENEDGFLTRNGHSRISSKQEQVIAFVGWARFHVLLAGSSSGVIVRELPCVLQEAGRHLWS
jgi:hypothetical protein